jgi:hypothetical protein
MSTPLGGDELVEEDEVMKARDMRDVERSNGESANGEISVLVTS